MSVLLLLVVLLVVAVLAALAVVGGRAPAQEVPVEDDSPELRGVEQLRELTPAFLTVAENWALVTTVLGETLEQASREGDEDLLAWCNEFAHAAGILPEDQSWAFGRKQLHLPNRASRRAASKAGLIVPGAGF